MAIFFGKLQSIEFGHTTRGAVFYAHSIPDESEEVWHLLRDHLVNTGERAGSSGATFGAAKAATLAGLLHDLGKYTAGFQQRLRGGASIDHATAGAKEVKNLVTDGQDSVVAELIAFAIAGHHAGMPDRTGSPSLAERLRKDVEPLDPVWRNEISPDTEGLLPEFTWIKDERDKLAFQIGFLGRMIFSCLVDADFRDTEAFYCRITGEEPDRNWPPLKDVIYQLTASFDAHMARKHAHATSFGLNAVRAEILSHARSRAQENTGFFTLTVPTGGGKTLTSLGFALDHAKAHGLQRIIYAIPFTSVIDQTAAVFRDVLGEDLILEHHSAIEEDNITAREQRDKLHLAMEDWAAPVVVTTNVQLFESLFANRPSRCRKLHNIAGSVIVLDEAQTIPLSLLRPCMEAMRELVKNYGVSIVFCTATQPALSATDFKNGLPLEGRELAPDPPDLAKKLRRTTIQTVDELSDEGLIAELDEVVQGLVIVNSRKHALDLYNTAREVGLDGLIHLTTRQYAAHRREILNNVHERLATGQPCRLIATSLVEAGVDIDFPRVWRAEAGLDQIAQAAGRCNREGRLTADESIVTVFRSPDNPSPFEIRQLAGDFGRIAHKHPELLSPEAIRDYFGEVYWRKGDGLDAKAILDCFRINGPEADIAYRTIAENFRMIESGMAPVIIARDADARCSLDKLGIEGIRSGRIARELQPYVVQVPPKARNLLWQNGHVKFACESVFGDQFCVLHTNGLYQGETGLLWENAEYLGLENQIV